MEFSTEYDAESEPGDYPPSSFFENFDQYFGVPPPDFVDGEWDPGSGGTFGDGRLPDFTNKGYDPNIGIVMHNPPPGTYGRDPNSRVIDPGEPTFDYTSHGMDPSSRARCGANPPMHTTYGENPPDDINIIFAERP